MISRRARFLAVEALDCHSWCYFLSTWTDKSWAATPDGKDSLSAVFHPHGPTMSYSHTTNCPGGQKMFKMALLCLIFTAI